MLSISSVTLTSMGPSLNPPSVAVSASRLSCVGASGMPEKWK